MNRVLRWTGIAFLALAAIYIVVGFLQDLTLPAAPSAPAFPIYPLVVAAALAGLGYLAYVAASNNAAAWGWPRAVVVLAVIAIVGYVLWEYRRTSAGSFAAAGSSTSVPGVDPSGLGGLGVYPVPPPGSVGSTKTWDPSKKPMETEGKAPAFASASARLDDSKPFAGDLTQARWCAMCASGKLRRASYDRLGCDPSLCQ